MADYKKLKEIYDEIDVLITQNVTSDSESFEIWYAKVERFLQKYYGKDSYEYKNFSEIQFHVWFDMQDIPPGEHIIACERGLVITKGIFKEYLEEMRENSEKSLGNTTTDNVNTDNFESVFIIHGHNDGLKASVARVIERQGIKAIILHEQADEGATIIEKFEKHSDVSAAIALFTADDIGCTKENKPKARQNVVFETGFFMGKRGRKRVILIAEKGVELPSDLQGVVYTDSETWQFKVLKELKTMGFVIDYEKL